MSIPIICINLDRSVERKELMIEQFNKLKMIKNLDYWFFQAFDSKYITNNSYGAKIGVGYGMGRQFKNAELSIINSHIAALKFAKMLELKEVIIIEDDIFMCEDWFDRIVKLKKLLDDNWDFIYLSGHSDYAKIEKSEKSKVIDAIKMSGAYSYMVNCKAYDKIIGFCDSYMTTFDDMIMNMISLKKINAKIYLPFMTYHTNNVSTLWESESKDHDSKKYFVNKLK